MRLPRRTATLAALAALTCLLQTATTRAAPTTDPPASAPAGDGCEQTSTLVRLVATSPAISRVAGWLCQPPQPAHPDTVQLLVHGFSYNHWYWLGLGYPRLDYIRAAASAGYPTFVIDQIGAGFSTHPDPNLVTFPNLAYVLHQLVTDLRTGRIGHPAHRFARVVGVGHSMGAGQWLTEASTYRDVDAVVVADFLHTTDAATVATLRAHNIVVANTEPRFAGLPAGYLTMQPRSVFYDPTLADPQVIARDERIGADTGTVGELATIDAARDPQLSARIRVPVLVVTGRQDTFACNPGIGLSCATASDVLAREAGDYPTSRCLGAYTLDSGHDTNLHPDAPAWFGYAAWWITTTVAVHHGGAATGRACAVHH